MANKAFNDVLTLTASYQQITSGDFVGSFTVHNVPGNTGTVYMLGSDGSTNVELPSDWWQQYDGVRLSDLQFKSDTVGDKILVTGYQGVR
jgi:hypothetical protein